MDETMGQLITCLKGRVNKIKAVSLLELNANPQPQPDIVDKPRSPGRHTP